MATHLDLALPCAKKSRRFPELGDAGGLVLAQVSDALGEPREQVLLACRHIRRHLDVLRPHPAGYLGDGELAYPRAMELAQEPLDLGDAASVHGRAACRPACLREGENGCPAASGGTKILCPGRFGRPRKFIKARICTTSPSRQLSARAMSQIQNWDVPSTLPILNTHRDMLS